MSGDFDYLGPAKKVQILLDGDPVGADKDGNHPPEGSNDEGSANLLRKSADVLEIQGAEYLKMKADPNWPQP